MYIHFEKRRRFRSRFICRSTCCRCGGTGRMSDGSICYHCQGTGFEIIMQTMIQGAGKIKKYAFAV